MIGESIGDSNGISLEVNVYLTDNRVVTGDFLAVEYACEGLLWLIIRDGGVVVVEGELLPFAQDRQLLSLGFIAQLQYLYPVHLVIYLLYFVCFLSDLLAMTLFIYLLVISILELLSVN